MITCSECRFWKVSTDGSFPAHDAGRQVGTCHVNPPTAAMVPVSHPISGQVQLALQSYFPLIRGDEFCGQGLYRLA